MTDYLGPTLHDIALVVYSRSPQKAEPGKDEALRSRVVADLSDWVLYVATAVFIADVMIGWSY